jgi:hypothetical protein
MHRSKHDKRDISQEPEMKELKALIEAGDLDFKRTIDHLKRGSHDIESKEQR